MNKMREFGVDRRAALQLRREREEAVEKGRFAQGRKRNEVLAGVRAAEKAGTDPEEVRRQISSQTGLITQGTGKINTKKLNNALKHQQNTAGQVAQQTTANEQLTAATGNFPKPQNPNTAIDQTPSPAEPPTQVTTPVDGAPPAEPALGTPLGTRAPQTQVTPNAPADGAPPAPPAPPAPGAPAGGVNATGDGMANQANPQMTNNPSFSFNMGGGAGGAPAGGGVAQNAAQQAAQMTQVERAANQANTKGGIGTGLLSNLATFGMSGLARGAWNKYQRNQGQKHLGQQAQGNFQTSFDDPESAYNSADRIHKSITHIRIRQNL